MNSNKQRTKSVMVTSVVLGLVSVIVMGVMKKKIFKHPLVKKLLTLKNMGLDSMKDFLEVSDLNYRIAKTSPRGGGVSVRWDSDESPSYLIFVSPESISKSAIYDEKNIPWLKHYEVDELKTMDNWIRKILVEVDPLSVDQVSQENTHYLPFDKFYSRVKSKQGRISSEISYPVLMKNEVETAEIEASVFMKGRDYYVKIKETRLYPNSPIYDYQLILYLSDGRGLKRTLPSFKDSIDVKLGPLDPCLCYLTGVREIGAPFEHFIGWIGEEKALTLNHTLDQYLDPSF